MVCGRIETATPTHCVSNVRMFSNKTINTYPCNAIRSKHRLFSYGRASATTAWHGDFTLAELYVTTTNHIPFVVVTKLKTKYIFFFFSMQRNSEHVTYSCQ